MSAAQRERSGLGDWIASILAVVVGLGAMSISVGMLRFESLAASLRESVEVGPGQLPGDVRRVALKQASAWTSFGPVAARARSLEIDVVLASEDPDLHDVEAGLSRLLELKPTYGLSWQSLAQVRVVNGASVPEVTPLVRMGRIMAPRDGHVMLPRAIFGIRNWSALDGNEKLKTVSDIRGLARAVSDSFQWRILAEVVGEQSEAVRLALRTSIASGQPSDSRILKALGL